MFLVLLIIFIKLLKEKTDRKFIKLCKDELLYRMDEKNYLEEINENDILYDGTDWMFYSEEEIVKLMEKAND